MASINKKQLTVVESDFNAGNLNIKMSSIDNSDLTFFEISEVEGDKKITFPIKNEFLDVFANYIREFAGEI